MQQLMHGKVKTVYDTEDAEKVLIKFHDKVTAWNGRTVEYPEEKGKVCCLISYFSTCSFYNSDTSGKSLNGCDSSR